MSSGPEAPLVTSGHDLADLLYHAFWAGVNSGITLPESERTDEHRRKVDAHLEGLGLDWMRL